MTTALASQSPGRVVTDEERILIKNTVAAGATDAELKLFLFDCARRGVHPLDRLLHFTKRGGRYTPVTSIDFMRSQAAASGEMAGSDDPVFGDANVMGHPDAATVTVYRMTQGQRFAYTATARWSEYCPDNAPMWKRMPHTMLGKCAEALALRKAFPQQLAGLYAKEEMDQAEEPKAGYSVTAGTPQPTTAISPAPPRAAAATAGELGASAPNAPNSGTSDNGPDLVPPEGYVYIARLNLTETRNKNIQKVLVTTSDGKTYSTINPRLASLCEQLCQSHTAVIVESKESKYGLDLVAVHTDRDNADIDAEIVRADLAKQAGEIS